MAKMIFIPEVATEVERTYTANGNYNINVGQAMSKITINANISQPKLYTPIISLSGNTLYISDSDNGYFASSYDIYYGASSPHNVSRGSSTSTTTEVNLQTFITTSGTYTITVVAKANNFVDSDESDSVSYTVQPSGYNLTVNYQGSFGGTNFEKGNIYIYLNKIISEGSEDVSLTSTSTTSTYTSPNKTASSTEFGDLSGTDSFTNIKYIYITFNSSDTGDCLAKLNGETLNISTAPLKVDITQDSTLFIEVKYTD